MCHLLYSATGDVVKVVYNIIHEHTHTHTDTHNELAMDGGYENITVAYQPAQPTLDFLKFINNNIEPGDTSADCILSPYLIPQS